MDLKNMSFEGKRVLAMDPKTPVAINPNIPKDSLRELAQDEHWGVRSQVARNPSTPEDVLRILVKDEHLDVKQGVADNPNIPGDLLQNLTTHTYWGIRRDVAENPKSSSKILIKVFEYEKSLREPDEEVIQALYENAKLPTFAKRVIETLFGDIL